jgi:hypothetical protein
MLGVHHWHGAKAYVRLALGRQHPCQRYSAKSIDKALANCSTLLSVHARIEIKNILARASLI